MKSSLRIAALFLLGFGTVGAMALPLLAYAQQGAGGDSNLSAAKLATGGYWGGGNDPLIVCTGISFLASPGGGSGSSINASQTTLPNGRPIRPCQNLCDILDEMQHLLYFALTVLMYILVPIFVFVGGITILISGGDPAKRGTGIKTIKGAVIGLAVGLLAFLIVNTFLWLIFTSTDTTSFTYTGDALGQNSKATQVSWPTIVCTPGAADQISSSRTDQACNGRGGTCSEAGTGSSPCGDKVNIGSGLCASASAGCCDFSRLANP